MLHDWPGPARQTPAYSDCVLRHRRGSRWIAFIDTDEFLFSPTGRPVPEVLRDYEQWPGIGVCRVFFGTSGHRTAPGGLVTESFTRRLDVPGANHNVSVKSAVDPERTASARNPHVFFFQHGFAVDENRWPLGGEGGAEARAPSAIRLRINHYWTRSEEELARKFARLRPDTGEPYPDDRTPDHFRYLDRMFGSEDDVILQFLPELREALRRSASTRW